MSAKRKIISLLLLMSLSLVCLASCKKSDQEFYGGDTNGLVYDPYDNVLKDPVDTGDPISVTGKAYVFENIDVRTAAAEKQVTAGNALRKLYLNSKFVFTAENKVRFEEGRADDEYFFVMGETEGVRSGNVLTVKHTNSAGVEYDIRFEIHEDKIYVIHNGHTYDKDNVYSTFTFTVSK